MPFKLDELTAVMSLLKICQARHLRGWGIPSEVEANVIITFGNYVSSNFVMSVTFKMRTYKKICSEKTSVVLAASWWFFTNPFEKNMQPPPQTSW